MSLGWGTTFSNGKSSLRQSICSYPISASFSAFLLVTNRFKNLFQDEDDEMDEDDISESGIQPPCYTPPEIPSHLLPPDQVLVTQPTPEIEEKEHEEVEAEGQVDQEEQDEPPPQPETKPPPPTVPVIGTYVYIFYSLSTGHCDMYTIDKQWAKNSRKSFFMD